MAEIPIDRFEQRSNMFKLTSDQEFQEVSRKYNQAKIKAEQRPFIKSVMLSHQQCPVPVHVINFKRTICPDRNGFFMVNLGKRIHPDFKPCFSDVQAPIHLFIIEKKILCH